MINISLSDQFYRYKKVLLFGAIISTVVIFFLINIFIKKSTSIPPPNQKDIPQQFNDKTPTPSPAQSQTGALTNSDKIYIEEHPDLKIEAKLRISSPIQGNGFVINFSYPKDKFLVTITYPYTINYDNFQKWFSDQKLKELSHFEISYN